MGRKRAGFRLTRRGKIVLTILSVIIIPTIAVLLRLYPGVLFSRSSDLKDSASNTAAVEQQSEMTTDRVDFKDNVLVSIVRPYISAKEPVNKIPPSGSKPGTSTAVNSKGPEVDEGFFKGALFIGDSITEGISAYGILSDANVFAIKGLTIAKAEKEIDTIANKKPEKIYILLGSNDLLYGMDSIKFTSEYAEFTKLIKDKLPETKIYIQSIFPVSKDVENKKPMLSNSRIDEFNRELKSMAEQQGFNYINVSDLLKDESGIMKKGYSSDGIHVKYHVYSIWLNCVKNNSV